MPGLLLFGRGVRRGEREASEGPRVNACPTLASERRRHVALRPVQPRGLGLENARR